MINREAMRPPHSDEAEHAVLGAMLMAGAVIDEIAMLLVPEHLYHPINRAICSTVMRLHAAGKAVDVITVYEAGNGLHDLGYLNDLVMACPSPGNVMRYAEIVFEHWQARELMRVGCDIADDAVNRLDTLVPTAERVDKAVASLMGIVQGDRAGEPELMDTLVPSFIVRLEERADGKNPAIPTGLADLDAFTAGGIRPGELWVIGARPSMGKTALTLTMSRNIAAAHGALFLSQEDSKDSVSQRFIASLGRVSLAHLRTGQLSDDEWTRVSEAVEALRVLSLAVDDQGSLTLLDVRRKVQQTRRRMDLSVVVIDYLQLMTGEGATRNNELGKISNGLKATAKELQVGIVLLSQLSREADKRTGPPQMSDLRDSGDIEGAADFIGGLYRPYMRTPTAENKHYAELHVMKQKNGPTGSVHLHFDGSYQRFSNWTGEVPKGGKRPASTGGGFD